MTTYPFIAARDFSKGKMLPPRAILWHFAEGGGTVNHLKHPRNDNSAHFVIEYSGRIVQVVKLTDAAHSAHVAIDADDSDASDCGDTYSEEAARSVLGSGFSDINRYCIAVEVEGFRKDGPNAKQADAIVALAADMRSRYPSLKGNLGHRDVQDYKACPGCHFPWDGIGGHGVFAPLEESDVPGLAFRILEPAIGVARIKGAGHALIRVRDTGRVAVPDGQYRETVAKVALLKPLDAGAGDRTNGYIVGKRPADAANVEAAFVLAADITYVADSAPAVDCTAAVAEAVAATKAAAHIVYG